MLWLRSKAFFKQNFSDLLKKIWQYNLLFIKKNIFFYAQQMDNFLEEKNCIFK